jgi:hypothetical protein
VNVLSAFLRYSLWALEFLLVDEFRYISIGIFIVLSIAAFATVRSPSSRSRPIRSLLFPLFLLAGFPLTIAIGVFFPASSSSNPNRVGQSLLNGLDFLAVAFAIYCVYRAKGGRWFAAALVVAGLWLMFAAGFIAGMSVTGDWL